MIGYALHPEAFLNIDEIAIHIGQNSPEAAHRVLGDIHEAIQNAVAFPGIGHHRQDLTIPPLRYIRVRAYLVAYASDEKPLWVVAVMHGHRSPRVMAAILRDREGLPSLLPSA